MSGKTSIAWTNATWNPVVGCTRVSPGCDHCYAFALHDRRHALYQQHAGHWSAEGKAIPRQYALPFDEVQFLEERLTWPLHQRQPLRIFVNSVSDLFHSAVTEDQIQRVFTVIRQAHWHTFQVLTKRAGRLRYLGPQLDWPANLWMGVSIETDDLTPRANALRVGAANAAVRFISAEPLLGALPSLDLTHIDWVITGGESGPGSRPCDPAWVRDLRDRCVADDVAFFHKQWGGATPKSYGRILDGRTWDEFPHGLGRDEQSW